MTLKTTLKEMLAILLCLAFFGFKAHATIHTVTVSNFQFSPDNITNVVVGDVIHWVWQAGSFNHTTTCDPSTQGAGNSLPAGADPWNASLNAGSNTFDYTVTVAGVYNYWCVPHSPNMSASFTASDPLPIKLSEFKIANENNSAVLKWITLSEENVDYFSVQKSKTGSDFTEIAKVPAAGHSSSVRSYNYTDHNLSSADKFYYYMIATIDKNGNKQFSPTLLFRNNINTAKLILSMSPNPVSQSGHLMLKFNADKAGKMEVNVANLEGKSIIKTTMQANEGVNNGHLMLEAIPAGAYSIIFELNGVKEIHKLIVK